MKTACFLLFFFWLTMPVLPVLAQADKRSNIWYFGDQAGLDFSSGAPTPLTDGKMSPLNNGGSSTICDANGQLALYSDGVTIWNRFHRIIPGAEALVYPGKRLGSKQNGLIVPHPKNPNWYYVFSIEQNYMDDDRHTIYYTLIDAEANRSEGTILTKLAVLAKNVAPTVAIVRHCNDHDFWLIAHELNRTNTFATYLLDDTGISTQKITSSIGSKLEDLLTGVSYLRTSLDGKLVALALGGSGATGHCVEAFRFDNKIGKLTQQVYALSWPPARDFAISYPLEGYISPSDIAFSPDNKLLYITRGYGSYLTYFWRSDLYQVDLATKAFTLITTETYNFGLSGIYYQYHGLEVGVDGRLYVSHFGRPALSVITKPNVPGTACNFQLDAVPLAGRNAGLFLPLRVPPPKPPITVTIGTTPKTNCNQSLTSVITGFNPDQAKRYQWFFEQNPIQNATDSTYTALKSGSYHLVVTEANGCRSKVADPLALTITNALLPPTLAPSPVICIGDSLPFLSATGSQITWYANKTLTSQVGQGVSFRPPISTAKPGQYTYYVTQTDANTCLSPADSITIQINPVPILELPLSPSELCLRDSGQVVRVGVSSPDSVRYAWIYQQKVIGNQSVVKVLAYGTYYVSATNQYGCVLKDSVLVVDGCYRLYIPTAFTPNADGTNEGFVLQGIGIVDYDIDIYDRWGGLVFSARGVGFVSGDVVWDGLVGGRLALSGLYGYRLRLNRGDGLGSVSRFGSVTVIR
jgi:gliding motility-associated-like protein